MNEIRVVDHGHTNDPRRRWMRNTLQEGPEFRFLATRSGRPPQKRPVSALDYPRLPRKSGCSSSDPFSHLISNQAIREKSGSRVR
jgi:hypothetical protein